MMIDIVRVSDRELMEIKRTGSRSFGGYLSRDFVDSIGLGYSGAYIVRNSELGGGRRYQYKYFLVR